MNPFRRLLLGPALTVASSVAMGQHAPADPSLTQQPAASDLPDLPRAVASFGAAGLDDAIYAFGGHVGKAHAHSRDNVIGGFQRLEIGADAPHWQALPDGPALQGTTLVATPGGDLLRIGGMTAHNAPEENEDMHSVASVQRFDVSAGRWEDLTPLPEGRSSHDAYVLGHRVYVIGGWTLTGRDSEWLETAWAADLRESPLVWKAIAPPPTLRRALTVAPLGDRIAVIGGLDEFDGMTAAVEIYDPATDRWTTGPDFPGRAFGVSAVPHGQSLLCSGMEGLVHRLDGPTASAWREVARLDTPRFFHRLVRTADGVFALGGAGRGGHLASVERIELPAAAEADAAPGATPHGATLATPVTGRWTGLRNDGRSHAAPGTALPLTWSESENLAWSTDLPGYGQSCPVVWGDRVFVTSGVGDHKETCVVTCFDVRTGAKMWERSAPASQRIEATDMTSRAAPSPVVDGERVYAFFESGDLMAFAHDGTPAWSRSLTDLFGGAYQGNHGFGSSLALSSQGIVLSLDHDGPSFVATFAPDSKKA